MSGGGGVRHTDTAPAMTPYVNDPDFTLYVGDGPDVLRALPDGSADAVVTSPPYWGLRDYGVAGQFGLEPTPEAYVAAMVAVFREARRVLADTGTLWLNLGDSYGGGALGRNDAGRNFTGGGGNREGSGNPGHQGVVSISTGLKPKDLVGIPWRVAFALQQDGWYLRSDIIWAKPNPMPESVTDRPTKAHEYVFLLAKQPRYWFDQDAVRERYSDPTRDDLLDPPNGSKGVLGAFNRGLRARGPDGRRVTRVAGANGSIQHRDGERWPNVGRNVRSVWEIATQPYPEAHFATYPEELVRRCILAGCPEWVCETCGKPRERLVERSVFDQASIATKRSHEGARRQDGDRNLGGQQFNKFKRENPDRFVGWSDCGHNNYRTGTVLDPFGGSGTTALVARRHGRKSVLIELNPAYAELAARRLQQLSLLAEEGVA